MRNAKDLSGGRVRSPAFTGLRRPPGLPRGPLSERRQVLQDSVDPLRVEPDEGTGWASPDDHNSRRAEDLNVMRRSRGALREFIDEIAYLHLATARRDISPPPSAKPRRAPLAPAVRRPVG